MVGPMRAWGAVGLNISGPEWAAALENLSNLGSNLDGLTAPYDADVDITGVVNTESADALSAIVLSATSTMAGHPSSVRRYFGDMPHNPAVVVALDRNPDLEYLFGNESPVAALASALALVAPYHRAELRLVTDCHAALDAKPLSADRIDDLSGVLEDKLTSTAENLSAQDRVSLISAQVALMRAKATLLSGDDQRQLKLTATQLEQSFSVEYGYALPSFRSTG